MNGYTNADSLHSQVVLLHMQGKTTEELQAIWQENDKSKWSKEDLDAVQKVLLERVGKLPEQTRIEKSDEQIKSLSQNPSTIQALKEKDKPKSSLDLPWFKYGSGAIVSLIVTMAANAYFDNGCRFANYQGNLLFIFIVTWISWVGLSSLILGGKSGPPILLGMFVSLVIVLVGAFFCIALTGFWIAPVCN